MPKLRAKRGTNTPHEERQPLAQQRRVAALDVGHHHGVRQRHSLPD
jgi:hypothetical protein